MNVQQLINKLEKIKNKQRQVYIVDCDTYEYKRIKKVIEDNNSLNIQFN